MSEYAKHREIFIEFRHRLENDLELLDEILKSIGIIVSEFNTSMRENRFIAGGATERILAAAMRHLEFPNVRSRGLLPDEEDLVVDGVQFSIKASFTGKRDEIRLKNTMGSPRSDAHRSIWTTPTLFVLANRGIGYADPDLLSDVAMKTGDATILRRRPLDAFHDANPEWLFECAVPAKSQDPTQMRSVSEMVFNEVIQRTDLGEPLFPILRANL